MFYFIKEVTSLGLWVIVCFYVFLVVKHGIFCAILFISVSKKKKQYEQTKTTNLDLCLYWAFVRERENCFFLYFECELAGCFLILFTVMYKLHYALPSISDVWAGFCDEAFRVTHAWKVELTLYETLVQCWRRHQQHDQVQCSQSLCRARTVWLWHSAGWSVPTMDIGGQHFSKVNHEGLCFYLSTIACFVELLLNFNRSVCLFVSSSLSLCDDCCFVYFFSLTDYYT